MMLGSQLNTKQIILPLETDKIMIFVIFYPILLSTRQGVEKGVSLVLISSRLQSLENAVLSVMQGSVEHFTESVSVSI